MTGDQNSSHNPRNGDRPDSSRQRSPSPRGSTPRPYSHPPVKPFRPLDSPRPTPSTATPVSPALPSVGHPIPPLGDDPSVEAPPAPRPPLPSPPRPPVSRDRGRRSLPPPQPPLPSPPAATILPSPRRPLFRLRIPAHWQFWAVVGVIASLGIGSFSLAVLLKLPALPNCPAIFWPTASASLRLYCAELAANKQTVDDLLRAIALVDDLPMDHPLRPDINQKIEFWSLDILDLAEEEFQGGDLDDAIAMVKQVPATTPAYAQVADQIQQWRGIWAEAEQIYQQAEEAMLNEDLPQAFTIATRLLSVGNTYWETVRYQELNDLITASREDGNTLARARSLARRGGLSNLQEAIQLAQQIQPQSPAHAAAQRLIREFGLGMLELAEATLNDGEFQEAIAIARQVPEDLGLQDNVQDLISIAMAQSQARGGSVADLEAAIVQAQRLGRDRPLYDQAQRLVRRWQAEIEDVNHLELAQDLAASGGMESLRAAIAEAERVPRSNPRGDEARRLIQQWTTTIQTTEDQPILDRADQLAQAGDVNALQAAINEASQIREGRALYDTARRRVRDWTARIQRTQDQPYLTEARRLAAQGNLPGAIAVAQQIGQGRVLYDDAQAEIASWQAQSEGQRRLQDASAIAQTQTPATLVEAIRRANQVPSSSTVRADADRMINIWSQQLLELARQQSAYSVDSAIAIASSIPPRTEAYAAAQLQIQTWQQQIALPVEEANPEVPQF